MLKDIHNYANSNLYTFITLYDLNVHISIFLNGGFKVIYITRLETRYMNYLAEIRHL